MRCRLLGVFGCVIVASRAGAQARAGEQSIPAGYQPPAGLCRIWVQGVPPDKQPAPTDCATALKNNPANGRVIFGPGRDSTHGGGVSDLLRARRSPTSLPVTRLPSSGPASRRDPTDSTRRDSVARRDSRVRRDSSVKRDTIDAAGLHR